MAAYLKRQVISENIHTDNRWSDGFRALTQQHGLKACWSTPIFDSRGLVVGTFAIYMDRPCSPTPHHLDLIEIATRLAGVAIERQLKEERLHLCAEIINRSTEAIRISDPSDKTAEQNAAHQELFGLTNEELSGKTSAVLFGEEQSAAVLAALKQDGQFNGELVATIDGQTRLIDVSAFSVKDHNKKNVCYVSLSRDVTEKRQAEELEERVSERTRIARDLHDTLLQNFQGLLLQFKAISYRLQPGEIKKSLDAAIGEASQAITEGRDTVQGLRTSPAEKSDLAEAIRTFGEELASSAANQPPVAFEVMVEGRSKTEHPLLRDEVYRIAIEALTNAFRHAHADKIEVELQYGDTAFTLHVRDNGRGIDRDVLSGGGRKGHFGLHGMRERAKLAGGELAIWSETDSGTEIELTIPASWAYTGPARRFRWFRKASENERGVEEKSTR
jgi:PAS domain S-box-containing protein